MRKIETLLANCIRSLDQTDRSIRKLEMFLNELQLLKHSACFLKWVSIIKSFQKIFIKNNISSDKDNAFIKDSFNSVFTIIRSIFLSIKFLEGFEISDDLSAIYKQFNEFDEEAIKDRLDNWQGDYKDLKVRNQKIIYLQNFLV